MGDTVQLVGYTGLLKSIERLPVLSSIVIMTEIGFKVHEFYGKLLGLHRLKHLANR